MQNPVLVVVLGVPWRHCRLQTETVKGLMVSGEHWLNALEPELMHLYLPASQPEGAEQGLVSMAAGASHCSEHTLIRNCPDWHCPNAMEIPPVHLYQPGVEHEWAVSQTRGVAKGEKLRGDACWHWEVQVSVGNARSWQPEAPARHLYWPAAQPEVPMLHSVPEDVTHWSVQ